MFREHTGVKGDMSVYNNDLVSYRMTADLDLLTRGAFHKTPRYERVRQTDRQREAGRERGVGRQGERD